MGRYALRFGVLGYLLVLLAAPVGMVFYRAFEHGAAAVANALTSPEALHALWLTLEVTVIAVACNTVFGVACAIALVRHRFPGRAILDRLVDLPFAVSPVVVGLALLLVYGQNGWFGRDLAGAGIQVIFSTPGIVLATIFVSLSFVEDRFEGFDMTTAYAAAVLLAVLAVSVLLTMTVLDRKRVLHGY